MRGGRFGSVPYNASRLNSSVLYTPLLFLHFFWLFPFFFILFVSIGFVVLLFHFGFVVGFTIFMAGVSVVFLWCFCDVLIRGRWVWIFSVIQETDGDALILLGFLEKVPRCFLIFTSSINSGLGIWEFVFIVFTFSRLSELSFYVSTTWALLLHWCGGCGYIGGGEVLWIVRLILLLVGLFAGIGWGYWVRYPEIRFEPTTLITGCKKCHKKEHSKR